MTSFSELLRNFDSGEAKIDFESGGVEFKTNSGRHVRLLATEGEIGGGMQIELFPVDFEQRYDARLSEHVESTFARLQENRPAGTVFNGPLMALLECKNDTQGMLRLGIGRTDYKHYVGSRNPVEMLGLGISKMEVANPLAVCVVLETADGKLVVTKRTSRNESYTNTLHAVGGMVNGSGENTPESQIREELQEELGVRSDEVEKLESLGLGYDDDSFHPELLYYARTSLNSEQLSTRVGDGEVVVGFVGANPEDLEEMLFSDVNDFVPTGWLNYMLVLRRMVGDERFAEMSKRVSRE